jgi:hypothetical protein
MATLLNELKSIEAALKDLQGARPARHGQQLIDWELHRQKLSENAYRALCDFERYRGSENLMMTSGNGAFTIKPEYFVRKLLDVTTSHGAQFAVNALRTLLTSKSATVKSNCLIWGVQTPHSIKLTSDLQIKPLPADPLPLELQTAINSHQPLMQPRDSFSLLSTDFVVSPVIMEAKAAKELTAPAVVAYNKFKDVASILCAFGPGPVVILQWWSNFADRKLDAICPVGGPSLLAQEMLPLIPAQPVAVNAMARRYVERYMNLPATMKSTLSSPLERMNVGMRRRSQKDQALDCGIALEMLLGGDAREEISYRLALRAALFLGKTLDERRELRKKMKKLYDLRSAVAHGSHKTHKDAGDVTTAGFGVCAAIIRKMVERGSIPVWADLELGARV